MERASFKRRLLVRAAGFLCLLSAPLWTYALFFASEEYSYTTSSFFVVPLLLLVTVMTAMMVARRDSFLQETMLVSLLARMAAVGAYLYLAYEVYGTSADAIHYFNAGAQFAQDFSLRGSWQVAQPFWSNNFVTMVAGNLFIVIGSSIASGMVAFAILGFWGEYFFYRAFCVAFPSGDSRLAAMFLFLLPSLIFWSSSIGKDALMQLFLGLATYGCAILMQRVEPKACAFLVLGIAGAALVRPHVALMSGIAIALTYLLGATRGGTLGVLAKIIGVPLLMVGILYLAGQARDFLAVDTFSQSEAVLQRVARNSQTGASAFGVGASLGDRILAAPFLFFRPFPWEAHNLQAVIAASEGLLLMGITWRRRKDLVAAVRHWRSSPFGFFILVFLVAFSVIFSAAITNFGLLARERIMAMPLLLMLFCLRPIADRVTHSAPLSARAAAVWTRAQPAPDSNS